MWTTKRTLSSNDIKDLALIAGGGSVSPGVLSRLAGLGLVQTTPGRARLTTLGAAVLGSS